MGERCKFPHAHAHLGLGRSPTAGANAFLMHKSSKTTKTLCNYFHAYDTAVEPVTKRLRPLIRNFFIATDLITTLATNMG